MWFRGLQALDDNLGSASLTVVLFLLVVLRRILSVGVNISLLLLAGLSRLPTLPRLAALLTLAVLARLSALLASLAILAAVLLIFLHVACHVYSSVVCRTRLGALLQVIIGICNLVANAHGRVGNNLRIE